MAEPIALLVGLGNPGSRYTETRHNAGFWLLDLLARHEAQGFRAEGKFHGETARLGHGKDAVWLLKPQTFMNRSGQSVAALARFYRLQPEQIVVVHDEIDLPPGVARLKKGGGHGGHNGLRDIMAQLGSRDFYRLRIGVGHPGDSREVVNFVLQRAPRGEQQAIDDSIDRVLKVLPMILDGRLQIAMQNLHSQNGS